MSEEIFRKKSLDKIKSPESLNDYIRVSSPAVWLLMAAAIALLAGACIWGMFGHIDSTISVSASVSGGDVVCYIGREDIASVEEGMIVRIGDAECTVSGILPPEDGSDRFRAAAQAELPDGEYAAEIVTETIRPMSFVLN